MAMKAMYLFYPESRKKMKLACEYLNSKVEGKVDRVPPAYNPENQRLVVLAIASGKEATNEITRFCHELNKKRAANVAFIFDAPEEAKTAIMNAAREAGTNVISDVLDIKTGGLPFLVKFTDDDKKAIDEWFEKVTNQLIG